MTKTCFKCARELPLTEFYKHPQMADGHLGKCKQCTKGDAKKHRATNPEVVHASDRRRARTQRRREWRKANPGDALKIRVRRATGNAIRDGRLIPKPCEVCGATAEAHHDDYSKPLEVRWLCFAHHREHHARHP